MKYYIIAGEASGDLHASNLMKAIKAKDASAEFRFWGGDLMMAVGGDIVKHYKDMAFMGFWEVFKNLPTVLGNIRKCKNDILSHRPDVLVLVDYPGFNLRVAEFAKENGIKVVYYISPQIWAWKKGRIKKIKRCVDEMMVILPFEKDFYAKNGMDVHFVGHPLLDAVSRDLPDREDVKSFRKRHSFSDREIIAVLPGSRRQEVETILPQMLKAVKHFPQYDFVVSTVSWLDRSVYDKFLGDSNIQTVCDDTYPLLANSKAAVVASGTATLETAMIGVPQVVCYAGSEISYFVAKHLISGISYISLVNLIMDKPVVTELIQHDLNESRLVEELSDITENGNRIVEMKSDYRNMYSLLGDGSASANAADIVVRTASEH